MTISNPKDLVEYLVSHATPSNAGAWREFDDGSLAFYPAPMKTVEISPTGILLIKGIKTEVHLGLELGDWHQIEKAYCWMLDQVAAATELARKKKVEQALCASINAFFNEE